VVRRPEGVDLLTFVAHTGEEPMPQTSTVRLWLAKGRAAGLRRRATVVGEQTLDTVPGDVVELELYNPDSAAGWIAGFGADAVVIEPELLRKGVRERLLAVVGEER
jgi:proteasome accessory factor B